jgi:hypothetical protein
VTLKIRHTIIFFFIACMVCLTLQSTFLGLNKAGKIYKTQSSLNSPVSEEEENHKEKESDNNVILYHETQVSFLQLIPQQAASWPRTSTRCFTHVKDITVPPPELS